jgi:hypothetical protein
MQKKAGRENRMAAVAIMIGILFYLSKFLRPYFKDNEPLLFILGFLPNFGLAFAIPFIYVGNRIRLGKPPRHFGISCVVTFLLMILNEIRDQYQPGRLFDWFDIYASLAGVIAAFIWFHYGLTRTVPEALPGKETWHR